MAFNYLNPLEAAWHSSGLKYLFLPDRTENNPATAKPAHNEIYRKTASKQPMPEQLPKQTIIVSKKDAWKPTDLHNWDKAWQNEIHFAKHGIFAWTYWQLGNDLRNARLERQKGIVNNDENRKQRSMLLRRLIADLAHPSGTHTFWPISLPEDYNNEPVANAQYFWSGVHHLGCRGVIIMGSPAAKAALEKSGLRPLTQIRMHGFLVWILWDIDTFARESANYKQMLAFLRQSLKPFVHLDN